MRESLVRCKRNHAAWAEGLVLQQIVSNPPDIDAPLDGVIARDLRPGVDEADIGKMRSDLPFLARLGEELTRPVVPQAAAIDYTPSQYLCEFIKKCKYDGVIYRSSVSDGINLALFNPSLAESGAIAQYRVTRVSVEASPIR